MNREILFKANRITNGEWVEGSVVFHSDGIAKIYRKELHNGDEMIGVFKVDPSTVCQYTGLLDKNGIKIWEGDITLINDGHIDEEDGCFTVEWDALTARFILNGNRIICDFDSVYQNECEVIGNIFDNPELEVESE